MISNKYTVTRILITTDKKGLLNFKQNLHGGCQRKLDAFHFWSSSNKLSRKTIQDCVRHLACSQHAEQDQMKKYFGTRMHSSRMRTIRCSSRLGGGLPREGVCLGVSALGMSALGGVCLGQGCLLPHPLPVNKITDTCENITLPQLHCGR